MIIKLALENGWGYGKIQGEMKKLGYHVSVSYVRDVLPRNKIRFCFSDATGICEANAAC